MCQVLIIHKQSSRFSYFLSICSYAARPVFLRKETFSTATFSTPCGSVFSWYTYKTSTSPCTYHICQQYSIPAREHKHTSIRQKLGVGSSPFAHHPVPNAPVALPGLTKNFPSSSYASNLWVPPHKSTSTSICRAAISKLSASPGGMMVCPCVNPILSEPCVTTLERAKFGASTSKSPLTIWRSGAIWRRKS